jgi:hypothetical protein
MVLPGLLLVGGLATVTAICLFPFCTVLLLAAALLLPALLPLLLVVAGLALTADLQAGQAAQGEEDDERR